MSHGSGNVWNQNFGGLTTTSFHTLTHGRLSAYSHVGVVEFTSIVDTGISAVSITSWSFLEPSGSVITIALIFDTHLKDWEWNSILDRETVLVAAKVAVVEIRASSWLLGGQ